MPHRGNMPKLEPKSPSMERGCSVLPGQHMPDSDTMEQQPDSCWLRLKKHSASVKKSRGGKPSMTTPSPTGPGGRCREHACAAATSHVQNTTGRHLRSPLAR
eukprot:365890-Chlamydomonas_euryale.AAC.3